MPPGTTRRRFLSASAAAAAGLGLVPSVRAATAAAAASRATWNAGELAHLLPACSDSEVLLKCSFRTSRSSNPLLEIGQQTVRGVSTDRERRFFQFHVRNLQPGVRYDLRLREAGGSLLCDPWPLSTMPARDATPNRVRLLAYTCAGGPPDSGQYLPLAIRNRLLDRAMSFGPDAIIANGDHVYWDLRTTLEGSNAERRARGQQRDGRVGSFDRSQLVLGGANEDILKRAVGPQIAELYGTRYRSTPVFFFSDDHDYFENDEADEKFVTFPPEHLELELQRATQHLYYPEFLADAARPVAMPGSAAADRAPGLSECYGTLRYGKLLEVLMYDCGRHVSLKGPHAGLVAPEAEAWLMRRIRAQDTRHLINIPSTPLCWSAGKWREWYPDLLETDSSVRASGSVQMTGDNVGQVSADEHPRLGTTKQKFMWQEGWFRQHQRLLQALVEQPRPAIFMSGDLHACGWDRMLQSADLDLRRNAPYMLLHGPLGTGERGGWPSRARGIGATAATQVTVQRKVDPVEKNGFAIIDVMPDRVVTRLFAWRAPDPLEAIDTLEPFDVVEIRRDA